MTEQQDENTEQFDRYMLDQMDEQEKARFLEKLEANAQLLKEFETYRLVFQGINFSAAQELKEKLVAREKMLGTSASYSRYWKVAAAVALLAVAAFLVTWLTPGSSDQDLYSAYYEPYPNIVNPLDRSSPVSDDDVFRLYEKGQYQQTVDYFRQRDDSQFTDTTRFYLGQAHMALGEMDPALKEFDKIPASSIFFESSQWYLSLIHLKRNNRDQLKQQLEKIIGQNGSYKKKAQELLINL